jgi:AraC-like DNA-binding protein
MTLTRSAEYRGDAIAPDLANRLVDLLDGARRQLDHDQEAAREMISRAWSLVRGAIGGDTDSSAAADMRGRLADWQVRRLKDFIDERLDQAIRLEDLAQVARRSRSHICYAFKRSFGETPHAYIIGRRLRRASQLMLASDMALSQIALSCGFGDQPHFCRLFRKRYGQSPASWRRKQSVSPFPLAAAA